MHPPQRILRRSPLERLSNGGPAKDMNGLVFALLLAAGCAGIVISFARARSRAVFAQDGFVEPGRRTAAVVCLPHRGVVVTASGVSRQPAERYGGREL